MTVVAPLYSGSSGNSTYIGTRTQGVLVDAGVSARNILRALDAVGVEPEAVQAILITHEHSDHVKGLKNLAKRLGVPVMATEETLAELERGEKLDPAAKTVPLQPLMEIGGMEVRVFDVPHDAAHPVGFRIQAGERSVGITTDLGQMPIDIHRILAGVDLAVVESNYETRMLECSPYPYYLRRRIASRYGHLANDGCAAAVRRLALGGTARFILAHLSQENNTPDLAEAASRAILLEEGMKEGRDFRLWVARRDGPMEPVRF